MYRVTSLETRPTEIYNYATPKMASSRALLQFSHPLSNNPNHPPTMTDCETKLCSPILTCSHRQNHCLGFIFYITHLTLIIFNIKIRYSHQIKCLTLHITYVTCDI